MIVAGLATIERRFYSLMDTIDSLLPQVDHLHVHCNDYLPEARLAERDRLTVSYGPDYGDAGKFFAYDGTSDCLTCDDDLIYPPDYVAKMLAGRARHPNSVLSFHGAFMPPGWQQYFRDRHGFPCLGGVPFDTGVHVIGTGVALIPPGLDRDELSAAPRNMADINVAVQAHRLKMPLWVLAHDAGWIQHSEKVDLNDTIWATAHKDDRVHSELLRRALDGQSR